MRIAVMTMVFNEAVFLPIWLAHYGPRLGFQNLFVIDDGSNDGSTLDARIVNLIRKKRSAFDEDDRAKLMSCFHEELLHVFDVVIYTDVDELIVVNPTLELSLSEYLSSTEFDYKNVIGLNVLHHMRREAEIELDKPLFRQRKYVQFNVAYCKPLVSKIPINWVAGFHRSDYKPRVDTNLFLFHIRAMDLGIARERLRTLNTVVFSYSSIMKQHGWQFRATERAYLDAFFSTTDYHFANAIDNFDFINSNINDLSCVDNAIARVPDYFRNEIQLNVSLNRDTSIGANADRSPINIHAPAIENNYGLFANAMRRMISETPYRKRIELCPCGSGKRFKHCHGTLIQGSGDSVVCCAPKVRHAI
jgi:hypothetical protein